MTRSRSCVFRIGAALLGCLALTAGAAAQPPKATTTTEEQKAREAFRNGKVDDALKALEAAAKANPGMSPSRVIVSRWFLEAGQGQLARSHLERAAAEDPDHPDVYLTNASYALREGRVTDAALSCQAALDKSALPRWTPDARKRYQRDARLGLVAVYEVRGHFKAAREVLRALIEADPNNPQHHRSMGRMAFLAGDPDAAFGELQAAFRLDPVGDPPELGMALLWGAKFDFTKAEEWHGKAAQAHGGLVRVHVEFARYLLARGRLDAAKAHLAAAQKLDPKGRDVRAIAGLAARHEKNYPTAVAIFEELVRDHPTYGFATGNLALALAESADPTQRRRALDLAELYVKQNPQAADGYAVLGYCLYKNGRLVDAEKALALALSPGQVSPDTAYFAARVLADRGNGTEAQRLLKLALESKDAFVFRKDAETLLADLQKKQPPKKP